MIATRSALNKFLSLAPSFKKIILETNRYWTNLNLARAFSSPLKLEQKRSPYTFVMIITSGWAKTAKGKFLGVGSVKREEGVNK